MTAPPNPWVDEDRPEVIERVVDAMVAEMTLEEIRQYVWDSLYDELIHQHWSYTWEHVEKYAPELIEEFG